MNVLGEYASRVGAELLKFATAALCGYAVGYHFVGRGSCVASGRKALDPLWQEGHVSRNT